MKKILSLFLIIVIVVLITDPLMDFVDSQIEQKEINESKPTQEEILEFQSLLNDNTYFYYNNLNDADKDAYITMYSSLMNFENSFTIETDGENLKNIFTAVLYDNPHIFWVDNDYQYLESDNSVKVTPSYRNTTEEAQQITLQINKKISEIVSYANTLNSDYEKELYLHNYICKNTVYDETLNEAYGDSVYGALINGVAICEGYSRAMQILLDAVDIDNYLVIGDGESDGEIEPHMWNIVEIDDSYYHLDVTWNDSGEDDSILYFYFNVNDEMIGKDHFNIEPENNFCLSDLAYYYMVEKCYVENYNGFKNHFGRSSEILKSGENKVEFLFENSTDFQKALNDIENDNGFFDYIYSSVKTSGRKLNPYKLSYYTIDAHNYLCVVLEED